MEDIIAQTSLTAVLPTGEQRRFNIEISKPYHNGEQWRCAANIKGLHSSLVPIAGEDALQALCLGLRFVHNLLDDFLQKGGQLLNVETGEAFPLDATFGTTNSTM